jgi:hypothetical protein
VEAIQRQLVAIVIAAVRVKHEADGMRKDCAANGGGPHTEAVGIEQTTDLMLLHVSRLISLLPRELRPTAETLRRFERYAAPETAVN